MIIERIDLYDFKLWVTEGEFELLKRSADERCMRIESIVSMFIIEGIQGVIEGLE